MTSLAINEIHEGDCLELMKDIPTGSVDMILCDLPYGTTDIKGWDKLIPAEKLWEQYNRIIKDDGNIVLFGSQPFTSYLIVSNPKMFRYEWIWDKTKGANFLNANHQPLKTHENVLVFAKLPTSPNRKGTAVYNPQKTDLEKSYIYSDSKKTRSHANGGVTKGVENKELVGKHPKSIQTFKKDGKVHPTQKPVNLCEFLIRTYTKENEVVLDNCIGSGTTAIAAINTNRNYIGIEQDVGYVAIARQRIADARGGERT